MTSNFSSVFPNGISLGSTRRLNFTSAVAVQNFLPTSGTPSCLPSGTLTNPGTSYNNELAGQVLVLTLNAYFDANNPNFSTSSTPLLSHTITSGSFSGMSVANFLSLANSILGTNTYCYNYTSITNMCKALNENYENGTSDDGFLACPPACNLTVTAVSGIIRCAGQSTTVVIGVSGGTSPYTGLGTFTRSAGTYTFPVTSANGCNASAVITLTQPAVMNVNANAGTINCNGGTTTLNLTATGGTAPYTGLGTFTRSAGAYSYTVTDSRSCTSIKTGTITQPAALIASATIGTINCNGGTTTVNISASGGTAPYAGTGTFTRTAGPFSYTVCDVKGCVSTISGTITQSAALIASANNWHY